MGEEKIEFLTLKKIFVKPNGCLYICNHIVALNIKALHET